MGRTILITGAAGFVGHHMVEHLLKNTGDTIIGVDSLTYAGTWDRLRDVKLESHIAVIAPKKGDYIETSTVSAYDHPRFTPLVYDFRNTPEPNLVKELKDVTHILHLGAESHVDNSISDPLRFVQANVVGTVNMLNLARQLPNLELFVYFSTDEVFGPAPMAHITLPYHKMAGPNWRVVPMKSGYSEVVDGERVSKWEFIGFKENDLHNPKNPYAATKSAAEQIVTSFANTYNLPCVITRQMNIMGERQHPEKFIPMCIRKSIEGGDIVVHATPDKKQAGKRHYIHARNVADAHLFILDSTPWISNVNFPREVPSFHIVGELEVDNLTLAKTINEYVGYIGGQKNIHCEGIGNFHMVDFHSSRQGHDLRYALDGGKMKDLGWTPPNSFHESLKKTIAWSLDNQKWLKCTLTTPPTSPKKS